MSSGVNGINGINGIKRIKSENVIKTFPNTANPHIRIYREIGQQVLASIEDGRTQTKTDVTELYIRYIFHTSRNFIIITYVFDNSLKITNRQCSHIGNLLKIVFWV